MAKISTQDKKQSLIFNSEEIDLIRNTVAKGATDNELKLFLYQAQRTGLDPLTRQIYFVKRGMSATVQTSIDGFRVIAERSGQYAGQDEPQFEEGPNHPIKCTVTVYKFAPSGERYPAGVGVAYWDEYCPPAGQDMLWRRLKHTLLSKCAEALALRKAFPQDLSGLYTDEEMDQMGDVVDSDIKNLEEQKELPIEEDQRQRVSFATNKQKSMIQFQRDRIGMSNEELINLTRSSGIRDPQNMTKSEASRLIETLLKENNHGQDRIKLNE